MVAGNQTKGNAVILKREALKNLQQDTGMFAGLAFADILETFRRFFTSLRFVQNDRNLPASLRSGFPAKRERSKKTKRKRSTASFSMTYRMKAELLQNHKGTRILHAELQGKGKELC